MKVNWKCILKKYRVFNYVVIYIGRNLLFLERLRLLIVIFFVRLFYLRYVYNGRVF